ncbi:unnamed protein product [Linum trigynum]|uniref:Uncharacterized protein n=1 Tax=Linum trigynum TaxID=586398 RepID=A0AAV2FLF3_9ROSI
MGFQFHRPQFSPFHLREKLPNPSRRQPEYSSPTILLVNPFSRPFKHPKPKPGLSIPPILLYSSVVDNSTPILKRDQIQIER